MSSPQTRRRSSRLSGPQEALTESAKRQLRDAGGVATEAVTSGAWAYPLLVSISSICRRPVINGSYRAYSTSSPVSDCLVILCRAEAHVLADPSIITPLLPALFKGIILSFATIAALFTFTYLPQVAILAFVSGPLGELQRHQP